MIEDSIQVAFKIAMELGLKDVSKYQQDIFMISLKKIAQTTHDEAAATVTKALNKQSITLDIRG